MNIAYLIIVNNRMLGELIITPDPTYEIAEIWHDTLRFLTLGAIFFRSEWHGVLGGIYSTTPVQ